MSIVTKIDREAFESFVASREVPVFAQPWYLDIVCGDGQWKPLIVLKKDEVIGAMAYFVASRAGQKAAVNTKLQPYTCVLIATAPNMKLVSFQSRENEVLTAIAEHLGRLDRVNLKLYHTTTNWLPFYWQGYQQTTFYTYVIRPEGRGADEVRSGYKSSVRAAVKKAKKGLTLTEKVSVNQLVEFAKETFEAKGKQYPNDPKKIQALYEAAASRGVGKLLGAIDEDGNVHGVIFLIEDADSVYYLLSGSAPAFRNSGAVSLLLDEAITHAVERGKEFNFEGSMDQGIESFFRSFGAQQVPLLKIVSNRSFIAKMYELFNR